MLRTITRAYSTRNGFARMQLLGNVGSISVRETKAGEPWLSYSLAVNRYSRDETRPTEWYNITSFDNKHVEFFNNHVRPGTRLLVNADVTQRDVPGEGDEEVKHYTTLRQTDYEILNFGKRPEDGAESAQ